MTGPAAKEILQIQAVPSLEPEIGLVLGMLEDGRRRTLELLKKLSPDMLDVPRPGLRNMPSTLLYHMAAIELSWLYDEVLEAPVPPELEALFPVNVRDTTGDLSKVPGITLRQHIERLAAVRAAVLAVYSTMTLDEYRRLREMAFYRVTPEWVLHHLIQHEAEHRGQISQGD